MSGTIPPTGGRPKISRVEAMPMLAAEDFPVALLWNIQYADGQVRHGLNIVLLRSALEAVYRMLKSEESLANAKVSVKLVKCPELAADPCAIRLCDESGHNDPRKPQEDYCSWCGKKTRIVAFKDGR